MVGALIKFEEALESFASAPQILRSDSFTIDRSVLRPRHSTYTHRWCGQNPATREREVQTIHVETFRDNDDDGEDGVKGSL